MLAELHLSKELYPGTIFLGVERRREAAGKDDESRTSRPPNAGVVAAPLRSDLDIFRSRLSAHNSTTGLVAANQRILDYRIGLHPIAQA